MGRKEMDCTITHLSATYKKGVRITYTLIIFSGYGEIAA